MMSKVIDLKSGKEKIPIYGYKHNDGYVVWSTESRMVDYSVSKGDGHIDPDFSGYVIVEREFEKPPCQHEKVDRTRHSGYLCVDCGKEMIPNWTEA